MTLTMYYTSNVIACLMYILYSRTKQILIGIKNKSEISVHKLDIYCMYLPAA